MQSALAQLKTQEIISGSSNGDVAASNTASTTPTGLAQETGSNNGDVAASNTATTSATPALLAQETGSNNGDVAASNTSNVASGTGLAQ